MADIAAADVSYSIVKRRIGGNSVRETVADVTFGDGVLTYPAGGIPLTKAKLGLPNSLETVVLVDDEAANGLVYKYDSATEKIRIYEGDYAQAGDAPLAELDSGSDAPAAATLRLIARGF